MKAVPELEITFLGTGTSHGIPVIACDCPVCCSSDPRDRRTRTSILVRTPDAAIVVDTGPDFREQCLREGIGAIDAVLYTHSHTDHVMGFDDLRRFCDLSEGDIPVFAAPEILEDLRRVFSFAFDGSSRFRGYVRPAATEVTGPFEFAGLEIKPVTLPHGRFEVTGYVFSKNGRRLAAYYTDCHAVPPEAVESALDVEILVLDALRFRAHPTHMNFEQALEAAGAMRARRTFFTHMCHDVSHAETDPSLPDGVALAFDGLRVSV